MQYEPRRSKWARRSQTKTGCRGSRAQATSQADLPQSRAILTLDSGSPDSPYQCRVRSRLGLSLFFGLSVSSVVDLSFPTEQKRLESEALGLYSTFGGNPYAKNDPASGAAPDCHEFNAVASQNRYSIH